MTKLLCTTGLDHRFQDTVYLVEGNSFFDWEKWHHFVTWEQDSAGITYVIGYPNDRPVSLTFFWNKLNGVRVAWWESGSQLVDHLLIDKWFKEVLPDIPRTNQMNFGNVLMEVKARSGIKIDMPREELMTARSKPHAEKWEDIKVSLEFGDIEGALNELTDEERLEVFNQYCKRCGCDDPGCACMRDE